MRITSSLHLLYYLIIFTISLLLRDSHSSTINLLVHSSNRIDNRTFIVDYKSNRFLKDGQPFHYISGCMHYPRVLSVNWRDRLIKMKAAGLDAVQTYVFWNFHETNEGVYEFSGDKDLVSFIKLAQEVGLLVILRVGPYICAEWEFGGFPSWLLTKGVHFRTNQTVFMYYVDKWLSVLLPKVKPLLYHNGGPIIMAQVENEYGSFGNNKYYLEQLKSMFLKYLDDQIVLFTTDGNDLILDENGSLKDIFTTIDFGVGTNVTNSFNILKKFQPNGPQVNSEYYTGWLDYWGLPHHRVSTSDILNTLKEMLNLNISVNMYMFIGGTNFGFWSGADPPYSPIPTSYDYDAPLSEAGDPTDKYYSIRELITQYKGITPPPVPYPSNKVAYGKVSLRYYGTIFQNNYLKELGNYSYSYIPLPMEYFNQSQGFILYRNSFPSLCLNGTSIELVIDTINDRAHILLNNKLQGILFRLTTHSLIINQNCSLPFQQLDIFVENMGKINFGKNRAGFHTLIDEEFKGIIGDVRLNGIYLGGWHIYTLQILFMPSGKLIGTPYQQDRQLCFYQGSFTINETVADTYLYVLSNYFTKGQAYINGFNLGRYWPTEGPQISLYVPGSLLKQGENTVTLFELDECKNPDDIFVELLSTPNVG